MLKNVILTVALAVLVSGCASTVTIPAPTVVDVKPALNLADPLPVTMSHVHWNVVTRTNVDQVLTKIKSKKQPEALIGLNVEDYRNLTTSLAKLRSYISQQNAEIQAYKKYYESSK